MNINFTKSVAVSFSMRSSVSFFTYSFNESFLQRVSEYKYLGVVFTPTLSWSKHIEYTCSRALKKLGYLNHTLHERPLETKLLTYKTLIPPILECACTTWNYFKTSEITCLIQFKRNKFASFAAVSIGTFRRHPTLPLLKYNPCLKMY